MLYDPVIVAFDTKWRARTESEHWAQLIVRRKRIFDWKRKFLGVDEVKRHLLLVLVIVAAAGTAFLINHRNTGISANEAERIALHQAAQDGYDNAKLWTRFQTETKTKYFYSETDRKDVLVWEIEVDAANNPPIKNAPAVIYYIKMNDGSVVNTIKGLTRVGMDLHVSHTEVREGKYYFKLTNNGNMVYTIVSIEPALNSNLQTEAIRKLLPKIKFQKTIPPHTELSVDESFASDPQWPTNKQDIIIGFIIQTQEESLPSLIVDDRYLPVAEVP
ncbi:hypothetical protein [Paenibacillus sp. UNC496MF]|uniref:hypothetical protein n=1 Tax=Paenibacillus sp. UNC496MF TaxID=1502753 RepID=UPI001C43031C|nr:hypothetical protein [Paenibacillus sp. UNC496MF]